MNDDVLNAVKVTNVDVDLPAKSVRAEVEAKRIHSDDYEDDLELAAETTTATEESWAEESSKVCSTGYIVPTNVVPKGYCVQNVQEVDDVHDKKAEASDALPVDELPVAS